MVSLFVFLKTSKNYMVKKRSLPEGSQNNMVNKWFFFVGPLNNMVEVTMSKMKHLKYMVSETIWF